MDDINLLRDIDPNPQGVEPKWGSKIDAWNKRERARLKEQDKQAKLNRQRRDEINSSISRSNDLTTGLIRYLNHIEFQKLKQNIDEFKTALIDFYGLPLLEDFKKPNQAYGRVHVEKSEDLYLYVKIEEVYLSDICNYPLKGFKLCIGISKPNYHHTKVWQNGVMTVEEIQELVKNYPLDLSFILRLENELETNTISNYKAMSDFF